MASYHLSLGFNIPSTPANGTLTWAAVNTTSGTPVYLPNGFPNFNSGDTIAIGIYDRTPNGKGGYGSGYQPTLPSNWLAPTDETANGPASPFSGGFPATAATFAYATQQRSAAWGGPFPCWGIGATSSSKYLATVTLGVGNGAKGQACTFSVIFTLTLSKTGVASLTFTSPDPKMIVNPT